MIYKIPLHKIIEIDELTLGNIIVDGFLCSNYSFAEAQIMTEKVLKGGKIHNACTGAIINKKKVIHSLQRFLVSQTDQEIETASDNASEIMMSIV